MYDLQTSIDFLLALIDRGVESTQESAEKAKWNDTVEILQAGCLGRLMTLF